MVDVNTKIFDSLGTSVSEIIDKAAACFRGIYVMDISYHSVRFTERRAYFRYADGKRKRYFK